MKRTNLEILKARLVEQADFSEEKWDSFIREGIHVPFIAAMEDAVKQILNDEDKAIDAENKLREKLNDSKLVK